MRPEASTAWPGRITLTLDILDVAPADEITFYWNEQKIERNPDGPAGNITHDHHRLEFSLSLNRVLRGENLIEMRLTKRRSEVPPFVTLMEGTLRVEPESTRESQ